MPSTATITAFYSFTANTKARASLVNANFDIFRGHLLPVSPNTTTAINNTYDLGSTEYAWRKGYIGELNLGATSTSWKIKDDTTTGGGDLVFYKNSIENIRILSSNAATTSANRLGYAVINIGTLAGATGSSYNVVGSTCTIVTTGRPLFLGIGGNGAGQCNINVSATNPNQANATLNILLNGVTSLSYVLSGSAVTTAAAVVNSAYYNSISDSIFLSASTYNISLAIQANNGSTIVNLNNIRLWAKEII